MFDNNNLGYDPNEEEEVEYTDEEIEYTDEDDDIIDFQGQQEQPVYQQAPVQQQVQAQYQQVPPMQPQVPTMQPIPQAPQMQQEQPINPQQNYQQFQQNSQEEEFEVDPSFMAANQPEQKPQKQPKAPKPPKEDGEKSKTPLIIGGILGSVAILGLAAFMFLGNGDTTGEESLGISPNNKVDPETFNMHTHEYEEFDEPIDVTTVEKEDTLIYWEHPDENLADDFIGITEDGQLFGRVNETEAAMIEDEELQAAITQAEYESMYDDWKENPETAPDGEWLEDGTFEFAGDEVVIETVVTTEVEVVDEEGEVVIDEEGEVVTETVEEIIETTLTVIEQEDGQTYLPGGNIDLSGLLDSTNDLANGIYNENTFAQGEFKPH